MSRPVRAAWWIVLVGACGGQPIGSKVPKADPATVAVGAAAAATALTLANPNAAARKPERDDARDERESNARREMVPEGVLDRAEDGDADGDEPPCAEAAAPAPDDASKGRIELIPTPVDDEGVRSPPRPAAARCKPDGDGDGGVKEKDRDRRDPPPAAPPARR